MFANAFFEKNKKYLNAFSRKPSLNLGIVVIIPCLNEPDVVTSLESLRKCEFPSCDIEVIIAVNSSEAANEQVLLQNEKTIKEVSTWINKNETDYLRFYLIHAPGLPKKDAGVGLARKIAMDAAVERFNYLNKPDGIICSFDADALCDKNYFNEIYTHFKQNPKSPGASVFFEHPLNDDTISETQKQGIIQYELHLRYLRLAMQYAGLPYSFHTVGSSFCVRAGAYVKQGGMNKFQAGEDFYFLHKIIMLGNFSVINSTKVIPSPRVSDRVPFGTGAAMTKWINNDEKIYLTYCFEAFVALKKLTDIVDSFYKCNTDEIIEKCNLLPSSLKEYLLKNEIEKAISNAEKNSSSLINFRKRFYVWFDAFRVIKYLNWSHENYFQKQAIVDACVLYLERVNAPLKFCNNEELLFHVREIDKKFYLK